MNYFSSCCFIKDDWAMQILLWGKQVGNLSFLSSRALAVVGNRNLNQKNAAPTSSLGILHLQQGVDNLKETRTIKRKRAEREKTTTHMSITTCVLKRSFSNKSSVVGATEND